MRIKMDPQDYKLYKEYEKRVVEINKKLEKLYVRKRQLEQELYGDVSEKR